MKRTSFYKVALMLAVWLIPACASSQKDNWTITDDNATEVIPKDASIILRNFDRVENTVAVDIEYQQGENYSVDITGDKELTNNLQAYVTTDRTLVLKKKNNKKEWQGKVTMMITAPQIKAIKNSGILFFTAKNMSPTTMDIENQGSLKLDITKLTCSNFNFKNSGVSTVTTDVSAKESISITNGGSCKYNGNTAATKLSLKNTGMFTSDMKFEGENAWVYNTGSGRMKLHCDCQMLEAKNTGIATITFSGTADNTEIKSTGVSVIDCSHLNRF